MTAEDATREPMENVMYWGVESPFHMICVEADQSPKRQWEEILSYMETSNKEDLSSLAKQAEGDLLLTPLAIVCSDGPVSVVQAVLEVEPDAALIPDRYGELPIHRAALSHRKDGNEAVFSLLSNAKPESLTVVDKYGRTPLHCALHALQSLFGRRGMPSMDVIKILIGNREALLIKDKKGNTPAMIAKKAENSPVELLELLQVSG